LGERGTTVVRVLRRTAALLPLLCALALVAGLAQPGLAVASDHGRRPGGASAREHSARQHGQDIEASRVDCGPGLAAMVVDGVVLCTPGPDAPIPGHDPTTSVAPEPASRDAGRAVRCVGDGVSGKRFAALYVFETPTGSRFAQYRDSFQQWAADMDRIYAASAQLTGGVRHVRFVTDAACSVVVTEVGVPAGSLASFGATIQAVRDAGFADPDRNYLMFVDANVYCGIGTVRNDDRPTPDNLNNRGGGYVRVDSGCWSGFVAAHESMHNLGGVQLSAPNSSGGWHCTDERDVMCYSDAGNGLPAMRDVCASGAWARGDYFDCNGDDYFTTNPAPGSYLATHWNAADSAFLDADPLHAGSVEATPASARPESAAIAQVAGFPAGTAVAVSLGGVAVANGTTDAEGRASVAFTVPLLPGGAYALEVAGGGTTASTPFTVTPALAIGVGSARPGKPFGARATGFAAGERVSFSIDGTVLVTVIARSDGSATVSIVQPGGEPFPHEHVVVAQGDRGNQASATIKVPKSHKSMR